MTTTIVAVALAVYAGLIIRREKQNMSGINPESMVHEVPDASQLLKRFAEAAPAPRPRGDPEMLRDLEHEPDAVAAAPAPPEPATPVEV